jgi:hypothetical protein
MVSEVNMCRRCGAVAVPVDSLLTCRCTICAYITVCARPREVRLPLSPLADLTPSLRVLLVDERDHEATCTAITHLRHAALQHVEERVKEAPAAAQQWLLYLLSDAGRLSQDNLAQIARNGAAPFNIAQTMYALLLPYGPLDFGLRPPKGLPPFFKDDAFGVIGDACALSNLLATARQGQYRFSIENEQLVGERTDTDIALFELAQNIHLGAERAGVEDETTIFREAIDARLVEAQRLAFGHAVQDLFGLFDPGGVALGPINTVDLGLVGRNKDEFIFVDLARSSVEGRSFISRLVLTRDRWRRYDAPFFFDLGPAANAPRSDEHIVDQAGDALWFAYYPFLDAVTARRPGEPMAVTTRSLLAVALTTAASSRNHMLHQTQKAANRCERGTRDRVAELVREFHADFENDVANRFGEAAVNVRSRLTEIGGNVLECGEIDVLAGSVAKDGTAIVIVCEAKNTDLPLQKVGSYSHLELTIARACEQVSRKASWVSRHPNEIGALLGLDPSRLITVGLVVTSRVVPLDMLGKWPGAVPSELSELGRHLLQTPVAQWRADLQRGVVSPSGA